MENVEKKPNAIFWIIGVVSLLWFAYGVYQFVFSLTADAESIKPYVDDGVMTQAYADFYLAIPAWVKAAFGVATIGGLLASLCHLLRKKIAIVLFVISIISALIMYVYIFLLSGKVSILPTMDFIIAGMVVVFTSFMIWWSRKKAADGYLS